MEAHEIIAEYFRRMRHHPDHHIGLGDIRLTYAQQEEIINIAKYGSTSI